MGSRRAALLLSVAALAGCGSDPANASAAGSSGGVETKAPPGVDPAQQAWRDGTVDQPDQLFLGFDECVPSTVQAPWTAVLVYLPHDTTPGDYAISTDVVYDPAAGTAKADLASQAEPQGAITDDRGADGTVHVEAVGADAIRGHVHVIFESGPTAYELPFDAPLCP